MKGKAKAYRLKGNFKKVSSVYYDWSEGDNVRKVSLDVFNSELAIMIVVRNNYEECDEEFNGQMSDGILENNNGIYLDKEFILN